MTSPAAGSDGGPAPGGQDFSLALGGPLFQLLRRGRLTDDALGLVRRRIAFFAMITWAPLLVLSALQGSLLGGGRSMSFLSDIGSHLRFLVAVPLLIIAEPVVHRRMRPMVDQFQVRGLVQPRQMGRFADALSEARRLRNSVVAEILLVIVVYAVDVLVIWRRYALQPSAWYALAEGRLSLAGLWFVFASLPICQFLLCRWYFRLFIWMRFLWRVAWLDLDLDATHPDKAGGLGFLGLSLNAFIPLAAAHGVLLAGLIANRIFYGGSRFPDFKVQVVLVVVVLLLLFAGPLLLCAPLLARVKRTGLLEYGALAQSYVRSFDTKWVRGAPADEPLIGSSDIQSLADMANSFAVVEQMRLAPVSRRALILFIAAILAPILPLTLTMMPAEKLIDTLVGMLVPG
jgi:hypothetical protein